MGLWLGASVLAAAQLMDFCIMSCASKCCRKRKETNNKIQAMNNGKEELAA